MRSGVVAGAVVEAAVVPVVGDRDEPVRRAAGDLLHRGAVDPRAVLAADLLVAQRAQWSGERGVGSVDVVVDAALLERRVAAVALVGAGRTGIDGPDDRYRVAVLEVQAVGAGVQPHVAEDLVVAAVSVDAVR